MTVTATIVLLNGDGVGPEVVREAKAVLDKVAEISKVKFIYKYELIGGVAIDETGTNTFLNVGSPLPDKTLHACKEANAVLFGAVGGPQWPRQVNGEKGPAPESGLLQLRKELGLYANIRPMFFPGLSLQDSSPLKSSIVQGTDFIVVRELTGGLYFGERREETEQVAYDTMIYSVPEVVRITRIAAQLAMTKNPPLPIISVDKANVLASSRLWRRVVDETIRNEFPSLKVSHQLVDSCAMIMIKNPRYFPLTKSRSLNGIILTENMFGDILSDEASVIPGSLGLLPSASLSGWGSKSLGVYEPIHGSAPDIAGKGIANPIGTILSASMLLEYSLGMSTEARAIEQAVKNVLDIQGLRTADLGGHTSTHEMGDAIVKELASIMSNF